MKKSFFLGSLLTFTALGTSIAFAAGGTTNPTCTPIYGGGQTCVSTENVVINKTVANPSTNQMVDNLGVNDPKYAPDNLVTFRLNVTNTGGSVLSNVDVKDIFPQYIQFAAGNGSFDAKTKTLSFKIASLGAGETKSFVIQGKVASSDQLPIGDGKTICVINQSSASSAGQTSQDNAQLCIEKVTAPVETKGGKQMFPLPQTTTTPPTGPEALPLLALIPSGLAGIFLRKKSART